MFPYLYKIEELTITILEDYPGQVSCYLLVGTEYDQNITWTWSFKNKTIEPSCLTTISSNNTESTLRFNSTSILNKGYYYCTASNQYGSFTRSVSLRIKSKLNIFFINYFCVYQLKNEIMHLRINKIVIFARV